MCDGRYRDCEDGDDENSCPSACNAYEYEVSHKKEPVQEMKLDILNINKQTKQKRKKTKHTRIQMHVANCNSLIMLALFEVLFCLACSLSLIGSLYLNIIPLVFSASLVPVFQLKVCATARMTAPQDPTRYP